MNAPAEANDDPTFQAVEARLAHDALERVLAVYLRGRDDKSPSTARLADLLDAGPVPLVVGMRFAGLVHGYLRSHSEEFATGATGEDLRLWSDERVRAARARLVVDEAGEAVRAHDALDRRLTYYMCKHPSKRPSTTTLTELGLFVELGRQKKASPAAEAEGLGEIDLIPPAQRSAYTALAAAYLETHPGASLDLITANVLADWSYARMQIARSRTVHDADPSGDIANVEAIADLPLHHAYVHRASAIVHLATAIALYLAAHPDKSIGAATIAELRAWNAERIGPDALELSKLCDAYVDAHPNLSRFERTLAHALRWVGSGARWAR